MKKRTKRAPLPEGHLLRYDWSKATRGRLASKAAKVSALLRVLDVNSRSESFEPCSKRRSITSQ